MGTYRLCKERALPRSNHIEIYTKSILCSIYVEVSVADQLDVKVAQYDDQALSIEEEEDVEAKEDQKVSLRLKASVFFYSTLDDE